MSGSEEKLVFVPARMPENVARRFKAACALDGITLQEFFTKMGKEFADEKKIPE